MNYMRQQFDHRERGKKFLLSLKKNRSPNPRGGDCSKENDANLANRNLDVYNDYRNGEISEDEKSPPNSQNYVLRLSDNDSSPSCKKLPCYYGSNESKPRKIGVERRGDENTTVSISDSNDSSSGDNSLGLNFGKKKSSRIIRPIPYYPDPSVPTIIIESSDSEEEDNKQIPGMILLDSDDDSVLNTLKRDRKNEDPFDRLKRSPGYSRSNNNMSLNSAVNSSSNKKEGTISKWRKESLKNKNKTLSSSNSSGGSSSTHFSLDSNIAGISSGLNKQKIISESSSNDEESPSFNSRNNGPKNKTDKSKSSSSLRISKSKSSSSNDSSDKKVNNFANVTCRSNSVRKNSTRPYDSTMKLTKKDAEGILRGIKVGGFQNSYWTPKLSLPISGGLESESLASFSPGLKKNAKIINETASELLVSESNSEDEIISDSSTDLKPSKTHVTRFINPPNQEQQYTSLSDRKKNEISHWIMNNTPGSSSSSSIISESNRNSSFGNSSLERFELKHETPNNRGKISKPGTSEKGNSVPKRIEHFIYNGKTSVLKNQTTLGVDSLGKMKLCPNEATPNVNRKQSEPQTNLPTVTNVENLDIKDCADILDKLYGNVWRNKADAVLTPQTEPKNKRLPINKEELKSKTERKHKSKPGRDNTDILASSSDEDDFDIFAKDIRPNFNSTKKKLVRDSFIDDKSASENSSESFYHTALTNPRESKDNRRLPRPAPVSLSTKRAIAICDSESDLEADYCPPTSNKDLNKKRLSFSEDESDTSTSEFDPGELVLPKPKAKKAPVKTSQQIPKPTEAQGSWKHNSLDKKTKSFLASLSATVPIQNCHPEARVYRDNYKNKKEELCRYLFKLYNEEIFEGKLPSDMAIEWNVRMRGTAGFCYNRKSIKALGNITRSSRIVLATKILDTPDRLRDTLVHELCHAAAWLINNVSDGHGPFWKGWASRAVKVFPELPPIKRCHDYKIKTKFTYKCTKCGYSIGRHSKSLNIETKRCGHCYGKFELLVNRTTRSGTTQVATPAQARTPTGFALYVKENYHSVKRDRRSLKHAEVMKILGQQFSAVKIAKKPTDLP